jgi:hypothetical protein
MKFVTAPLSALFDRTTGQKMAPSVPVSGGGISSAEVAESSYVDRKS